MRFFAVFVGLDHTYSLILHAVITWNCLTSSRGTTHKIFFGDPMFGWNKPKFGLQLGFLSFSQVWFISFPWNYIQW